MCYYYWKIGPSGRAMIVATVQFLTAIGSLVWLFIENPNVQFGQLMLTIIISTIVNLFIPAVLVIAVIKQEKSKRILCHRIWLSWEIAYLLYLVVSLVYVALYQYLYEDGFGLRIFALNGISFFLHCAFLYTIFNFYEKTMLRKEEEPTRIVIHTEI